VEVIMELQRLTLIVCLILLVLGCKGKKKNYVYELAFPELKGAADSSEVPLSVDDYARVFLEPEGKSVLYIVARETKEGWGLGHGNELISYNLEKNLKLPLGKLGRSTMVTVLQLGRELKNAVVKTVDTDGNGDIDDRDCNQLYLTATFGLEDEPVSPLARDVVGVWQDPLFEWVVFAVSNDWPGRRKKKKEGEIDPTPVVMVWDPETKMSAELARCEAFYGFSPDGRQFGCLAADQDPGPEGMNVAIYQRGSKTPFKTLEFPVTPEDQVFLLGADRYAYTKKERAETGDKSVLWYRDAAGKEKRITNPSVDTRILMPLGDGGVVFVSRSVDSVDDFILVRAMSPDGAEVKTIFRRKGTDIDSISIAPNGKNMVYLKREGESLIAGEVGKARVLLAELSAEAEASTAKKVAEEYVASLGASILKGLRAKTAYFSFVESDGISVDIRKKIVYIPIKPDALKGEKPPDDLLLALAMEMKKAVVPVLMEQKYDGIVFSKALGDAHVVYAWEDIYGAYFTYLEAYGERVPVRGEYNLVIEDLAFRKMPGCKDPRLVQLHCTGWLAAEEALKAGAVKVLCRAEPLNPIQILREEIMDVEMQEPGGAALPFDVVVDKVDPRRSHRYSYTLQVLLNGKPAPFYDANWAAASRAWIELMRGLGDVLPGPLLPYTGRNEYMQLLAKWRPDSVVAREPHLDVHLFLDSSAPLPQPDDEPAWDAVAQKVMERVMAHTALYDTGREKDVRITLYSGNEYVYELWHKSPEELLMEAMEDPNWVPPEPEEPKKGKKKKKGEEVGEEDIWNLLTGETDVESHVPPEKLGLPKAMIDKGEVQKTVASHMGEVKYCYEKEAAKKDIGSGQITVRFVVSPAGKVMKAAVVSATLKSSEVQDCLLKAAQRWKFPKPSGEGSVTVNYPFTFSAGR
jgi:TonB family protein